MAAVHLRPSKMDLRVVLVVALLIQAAQVAQLLKETQAAQQVMASVDRLVLTAAAKEQAVVEVLVELQVLALQATAVMVELVAQIL
jgi:hypothetical protein